MVLHYSVENLGARKNKIITLALEIDIWMFTRFFFFIYLWLHPISQSVYRISPSDFPVPLIVHTRISSTSQFRPINLLWSPRICRCPLELYRHHFFFSADMACQGVLQLENSYFVWMYFFEIQVVLRFVSKSVHYGHSIRPFFGTYESSLYPTRWFPCKNFAVF